MPVIVTIAGTPVDNGPDIVKVTTAVTAAVNGLTATNAKMNLLAIEMTAMSTALGAINAGLQLANRGTILQPAVGVKSASDNFGVAATANVIARRNLLSAPEDIVDPPVPPEDPA